jgi:tetratricopeptide (TPR) repeat protein
MRRVFLVVTAASAFLAACPSGTSATDAGPPPKDPSSTKAQNPARPPFPNMATAAWGQRVLEERTLGASGPAVPSSAAVVLDALHELTPGSEQRAADLAVWWFESATSDVERGNAVALMAAALVLDPTVEGYKERLTDAYGLISYAGTLDASDSLGQSARAMVDAAAGAVEQGKRLIEVVATTPKLGTEPRLFLGLARRLAGDRGDAMIEDIEAALVARPMSARARALLAETWLDLGLYPEAIDVTTMKDAAAVHPWLDAIRGRALVLDGKVDEGVAALKAAEAKLDEGHRGDALYWLGRSLTSTDAPVAEIESIQANLAARAGYSKEAAVLQALLAQKAGDYAKAKSVLEPIVKGQPTLPVDNDAAWLLADACAGLGDVPCVDKAGSRGLAMDGDGARLQHARAAAAIVGKSKDIDVDAMLKDAFRASPFDEKLAEKVGETVVPGGPAAAARVRAARRALLHKAPKVVDKALAPLAKTSTCRVCRALDAEAAAGVDAATKGAKALEGEGPELAVADLVGVIHALGAAPVDVAKKALDKLAADAREPVKRAVARARADHADPDTRRRRDAGESVPVTEPVPSPGRPPGPLPPLPGPLPGAPPPGAQLGGTK